MSRLQRLTARAKSQATKMPHYWCLFMSKEIG